MALHATCYTDLKRYGHHVILRSEKNKASYQVPSISGYAADTALDLMAVTDENERPVEVHITKNRHVKFKGFAGVRHREPSWWFTELQGARSRTIRLGGALWIYLISLISSDRTWTPRSGHRSSGSC
jgi:hypothetical protein